MGILLTQRDGFIIGNIAKLIGFIMNAIAVFRENENPDDEEILSYLTGNLCRCSGYEGQLRGIKSYLEFKKTKKGEA